jgi:hypothetical protein
MSICLWLLYEQELGLFQTRFILNSSQYVLEKLRVPSTEAFMDDNSRRLGSTAQSCIQS